jgi:Sel1 repeat
MLERRVSQPGCGVAAISVAIGLASLCTLSFRASAAEPPVAVPVADVSSQPEVLAPLAAQGHATAQFNLGVLHDVGRGVWQDHAAAARWYRLAAKQGHAAAQFNLGGLYFEGQGVPKDLVRAAVWFTLAATAGFDGATRNRNSVFSLLSAEQITSVQQLARACQQHNYRDCD